MPFPAISDNGRFAFHRPLAERIKEPENLGLTLSQLYLDENHDKPPRGTKKQKTGVKSGINALTRLIDLVVQCAAHFAHSLSEQGIIIVIGYKLDINTGKPFWVGLLCHPENRQDRQG